MRGRQTSGHGGRPVGENLESATPHDEQKFFQSFYKANTRGAANDRTTIGPVSDIECRFHYNAVENAIIRAVVRREPPPEPQAVEAFRMLRARQGLRLLDVGSGAGHWVDFFREVLLVRHVIATEINEQMAKHLEAKYAGNPDVTVLCEDIVVETFVARVLELGAVDYVSAIGVMFHIVDDERWRRALLHLSQVLKPGGLAFFGGDFGSSTRNVQFHASDEFSSWKEFKTAGNEGAMKVNKRVRSLKDWIAACREAGLEVVDLVRAEHDPAITTPENDVLVVERSGKTA